MSSAYIDDADLANRKRSSRACDQCRKIKSKCDRGPSEDGPCRNCALSGTTCTYQGPSYKRGPPKGYIHAIEHRLHLVESVLASILSSNDSSARSVVEDLRGDDLASAVIDRVRSGPYGHFTSRSNGYDDSFSAELPNLADEGRSKAERSHRDSRHNRELVSAEQEALPSPTLEWQEKLIARIGAEQTASSTSSRVGSSAQRRRFSLNGNARKQPLEQDYLRQLYAQDSPENESGDGEDVLDTAEAFGKLSLDENHQIRYHGEASGMPFLDRLSGRTDGRNMGGLWQMPMTRYWPHADQDQAGLLEQHITYADLMLTPFEKQDRLIELYFTYVHPALPVIDQRMFMRDYASRREQYLRSERGRVLSGEEATFELLVQVMFATASRYENLEQPPPEHGHMWEAGCDFLEVARKILDALYHSSNIRTCQSLVLLGYRELGLGSLEQAWLFVGLAIRMAQDLGLNHTSDKWQRLGIDLFTPSQKEERKQIWWSCAIVDKYLSVHLGRLPAISERGYDTGLPCDDPEQDAQVWRPHPIDTDRSTHLSGATRTILCFKAASDLSVIVGRIIEKIYAVKRKSAAVVRRHMRELESQLQHWLVALPESLTYYITSSRPVPPPHILLLHCQYWSAVILLHRRFIPQKQGAYPQWTPGTTLNGESLKAFDLCQNAANRITNLVIATTFTLRRAPLSLVLFLLSAGIMHVATLVFRPHDPQAGIYLQRVLDYLKELEVPWPCAAMSWELLTGANVEVTQMSNLMERHRANKRLARDAFNEETQQQVSSTTTPGSSLGSSVAAFPEAAPIPSQAEMSIMMAEMLGFDVSAMQSGTKEDGMQNWLGELTDASRTLGGFNFESFTRSDIG